MGLRRTAALAVLLLATLAGCVDAPVAPPTPGAAPVAPPAPGPAAVARADVDFAGAMVPHHEQALELSAMVPGRSASAEVADLAFRIDREQVEEVGQLQGFLRLRGVAPPATGGTGGMSGMSGMGGMSGMADAATLARLRASSGPAFDRLWLATMSAHHEGALTMARGYLATTGGTGALAEFARTLLVTQQAEIDRMTQAR